MAKNTNNTPTISLNEQYWAEAIELHREALINFHKNKPQPLSKKGIAHKVYENSDFKADMEQKSLSAAINIENTQKLFGQKTRKEILQDIQRIYANDFEEIKKNTTIKLFPDTPVASYFRFKQYFMGGTGVLESDGVEAAQLDLFYEKEKDVLRYNKYELTIKAAANFPEIKIEGEIQCFGTDTLVLVGGDDTYFASTLIHILHKIAPSDEVYYHGFYLTYSSAGEKIAAPVILEHIEKETVFGYNDVPETIKTLLGKKRTDIGQPVAKLNILL